MLHDLALPSGRLDTEGATRKLADLHDILHDILHDSLRSEARYLCRSEIWSRSTTAAVRL